MTNSGTTFHSRLVQHTRLNANTHEKVPKHLNIGYFSRKLSFKRTKWIHRI